MREFYIIGAGMGTKDTLTAEAARVLDETKTVFATARLAELCPQAQVCAFSALAECAVSCDADRVALLVSGDVGFFSAAGKLREKLLKYGHLFETKLMDLSVNIPLEEALDLGWEILAECFEPNETGLKTSLIQERWPKRSAVE